MVMANNKLLNLPNELLLYILENFLELADLWTLLQTNRDLRYFSTTVIGTTWKIDSRPRDNTMKIQCRAALISLQQLTPINYLTERLEQNLHEKIIKGISSYKHKYVLIEDIDIRNRIRTTVDVVFHHAIFVAAITYTRSHDIKQGALASVLVNLLTKLDIAFPSYCREITYTLADNIKAFLEYTGYKILASNTNLAMTLQTISACFDLMGAAFTANILTDSHIDCAVQRTLELLTTQSNFKRSLLVHFLDSWLTAKRQVGSGELCRFIRLEIQKCDRSL